VFKKFVPVPTALQQRAKIVLPMVLTYVRLVPVNITKLATPALDALRVVLVKEKQLRALCHRIVFVLKTFVFVPTALKQQAQHVLPTMPIFVCLVPVSITKLATHALVVPRVTLALQKLQLALRHRIVFVLKTFVLVPMVIQ
jgi:hypothetical protein